MLILDREYNQCSERVVVGWPGIMGSQLLLIFYKLENMFLYNSNFLSLQSYEWRLIRYVYLSLFCSWTTRKVPERGRGGSYAQGFQMFPVYLPGK